MVESIYHSQNAKLMLSVVKPPQWCGDNLRGSNKTAAAAAVESSQWQWMRWKWWLILLQWWLQQRKQAAEYSILVLELAAADTAPKSCWRAISFVIYVKVPSLATKMVTVEAQQIVCDSRVVGRGGTRYSGSGAAAELATAELLAEA